MACTMGALFGLVWLENLHLEGGENFWVRVVKGKLRQLYLVFLLVWLNKLQLTRLVTIIGDLGSTAYFSMMRFLVGALCKSFCHRRLPTTISRPMLSFLLLLESKQVKLHAIFGNLRALLSLCRVKRRGISCYLQKTGLVLRFRTVGLFYRVLVLTHHWWSRGEAWNTYFRPETFVYYFISW